MVVRVCRGVMIPVCILCGPGMRRFRMCDLSVNRFGMNRFSVNRFNVDRLGMNRLCVRSFYMRRLGGRRFVMMRMCGMGRDRTGCCSGKRCTRQRNGRMSLFLMVVTNAPDIA